MLDFIPNVFFSLQLIETLSLFLSVNYRYFNVSRERLGIINICTPTTSEMFIIRRSRFVYALWRRSAARGALIGVKGHLRRGFRRRVGAVLSSLGRAEERALREFFLSATRRGLFFF